MSTVTIDTLSDAQGLANAWQGLQNAKPGIRIRDAAKELGTSEAQLLATKVGHHVIRLGGPWPALLKRFADLGRVMSLTRNETCILEHKGSFEKINIMNGHKPMATVIGAIETRVFFEAWHVAFAVTEEKSDRVLKSIQVFDKAGEAITKIYLQDNDKGDGSDEAAYQAIVDEFRSADQRAAQAVQPYAPEVFDEKPNTTAILADWSALKDTHDFFGMLRKHKVNRYDALALAAGKFTYQADAHTTPQQILETAAKEKLEIMIFAGNRGNLQIHQGKVRTIRVLDRGHGGAQRWLNVLDPDFNMHMRMDNVHSAWVVKKPTTDGHVTSIEVFDREKTLVAQFFGLRKPGLPENEAWRKLVDQLSAL